MATIGSGISLKGMTHDDFHYPCNLATGIVAGDVGKALALDASGSNKMKLAGDGDTIVGVLITVENRAIEGVLVGTWSRHGGFALTKNTSAATIAVGDSVQGAGAGEVKKLTTANYALNMVVEVRDSGATIIVLI